MKLKSITRYLHHFTYCVGVGALTLTLLSILLQAKSLTLVFSYWYSVPLTILILAVSGFCIDGGIKMVASPVPAQKGDNV